MTELQCAKALTEYRDGFETEDGIKVPPKSFELSDEVLNVAITCCESVKDIIQSNSK